MMTLDEFRQYAMSIPGVEEGPPVRAARRIAAFKVGGASFLGVDKGEQSITVSLDEDEAREVMKTNPEACEETWRMGTVFTGLRVNLTQVSAKHCLAIAL